MASWNGNLRIAKKLVQLGLDVNEAHFVRTYLFLFFGALFFIHCEPVWLYFFALGSCQRAFRASRISY